MSGGICCNLLMLRKASISSEISNLGFQLIFGQGGTDTQFTPQKMHLQIKQRLGHELLSRVGSNPGSALSSTCLISCRPLYLIRKMGQIPAATS